MARANYEACLAETLRYEGGYADHPRDPGGATMRGVTQRTYDRYRARQGKPSRPVKLIAESELQAIYRGGYWNPVRGDELAWGADLTVFDFGVNSGPSRAVRYLQKAIGAKVDGVFGPKTLERQRAVAGERIIKKVNAARSSFVRGLSTFEVFGKGWSRRIASVEAKSMSMYLTSIRTGEYTRKRILGDEAKAARSTASKQSKSATGAGAGSAASPAGWETLDWIGWGLTAGLVLLAVWLVFRAVHNRNRARAFAAE